MRRRRRNRHGIGGPEHDQRRAGVRFAGLVLTGLGAVLSAVGFISFFSSFGGFGPPRYFWCAFLGLPMLGVGLTLTKLGFLGAIGRYVAGEAAPVAKDTFNYLGEETSDGVRSLTRAVREGWRDDDASAESDVDGPPRSCPRCREENEADARFCKECGESLPAPSAPREARPRTCAACGEELALDARFCDQCGSTA